MNINWALRTNNKIKFFMRMKTFSLIFQGRKSKFGIFIRTKNLFNPLIIDVVAFRNDDVSQFCFMIDESHTIFSLD